MWGGGIKDEDEKGRGICKAFMYVGIILKLDNY